MNLFKKKKENKPVQLLTMTEQQLNEFVANAIERYYMGQGYTLVHRKEIYPEGTFFQRPDGTAYTPDGKDCDVPSFKVYTTDGIRFTDDPNGGVETTLPIEQEKPKRKYTKKIKSFGVARRQHKQKSIRKIPCVRSDKGEPLDRQYLLTTLQRLPEREMCITSPMLETTMGHSRAGIQDECATV